MRVERVDVTSWTTTSPPSFTVDERGQLVWCAEPDEQLTDHEQRTCSHGSMTLRQVWSPDRERLRRLVLEVDWRDGPMMFVEARRPHGGWVGDELGRLLLLVLSFGFIR